MPQNQVQTTLDQLCYLSKDVEAVALIESNGQLVAFSPSPSPLEEVVPPIFVSLSEIADRAVQEFGRGILESLVLRGSMGTVIGHDLGDGRLLLAVASKHAALGLLMEDVRACVHSIEKSDFGKRVAYA